MNILTSRDADINLYDSVYQTETYEEKEWSFFDGDYTNTCTKVETKSYYVVGITDEKIFLASTYFNGHFENITTISKNEIKKYELSKRRVNIDSIVSVEIPDIDNATWIYLAKAA